jgi:hypothetical protein
MYPYAVRFAGMIKLYLAVIAVFMVETTVAQLNLPYEQRFAVPGFPSGWTVQNSGITATIWSVDYGSGAGGGTCEAIAGSANQTGISRLVLPALFTTGLSELRFTFRYNIRTYHSAGLIFKIQSSSDAVNWADENFLFSSVQETTNSTYRSLTIKSNLGNITYLAFVMQGDHSDFINWNIDDVFVGEFTAQANCPGFQKPDNGQTNVPLIGSITWRSGLYAMGNTFFFGTDNPPTNIVNGLDMGLEQQYNYAPLLPNTQYRYKILTYNNMGVKPYCSNYIFTTTPALTLPFTDSFPGNSIPSYWVQQAVGEVDKPPQWGIWYYNEAGGTNHELACEDNFAKGLTRIISPPLNTSGLSEINLKFNHKIKSLKAGLIFKIQTSSDGINWTDEQSWSSATGSIDPEIFSLGIHHNLGNYTFICFTVEGDFSVFEGWYIDNVVITPVTGPPACVSQVTPADSSSGIAPGTDLSWSPVQSASGYRFFLGTDNPPFNVYDDIDVGNKCKVDFSILQPGQTYYWSIVPYNQSGSATGCPVRAFTTVQAQSVPYSEDFSATVLPQGWLEQWTGLVDSSIWNITTIMGPLSPFAVIAEGEHQHERGISRLILPPIDTGSGYNLNLAFKYHFNTYDTGLVVKIQSSHDCRNWVTENWIKTTEGNDNIVYSQAAQVLVPANTSGPTYLAFVVEGNHDSFISWIIDSVRVQGIDTIPGCNASPSPPDLGTGIALNTTLAWSKNAEAMGYRLYLGTDNPPANILNGIDLGPDTSWHESLLASATQYYWKVVPYNNAGNADNCLVWSFSTSGPLSLPFTESFNSSAFPAYWSMEQYGNRIIWTHDKYNTPTGIKGQMKAKRISNFWFNSGVSRLVSPPLNTAGLTGLTLSFRHTFEDSENGVWIKVQSSADGLNWTDETWYHRGGDGIIEDDSITVSIGQNVGNITFIAFTLEGGLSSFYEWYIDDITVTAGTSIPGCTAYLYPPDGLNDAAERVKLSWEKNPLATSYKLFLGTDNPPTNLISNLTTGVINEYYPGPLEPGEQYFWQVIPQTPEGSPDNCSIQSFTVTGLKNLPFTDTFNTSFFPAGWWQEHNGGVIQDIWSISNTNLAGEMAPELSATGYNAYGTTRLVTPPLNTANCEYITLKFKQRYHPYYYDACMYIQSSTDGNNWTSETMLFTGGDNMSFPATISVKITHNLGAKTYLAVTTIGNHITIDFWRIDNIEVMPPTVVASPEIFTMSAPNLFCQGSAGVTVALSGSQLEAEYSLYKGTAMVGTPVAGTGLPLTWPGQTAGTYLIVAKYSGTYAMMTGGKQILTAAKPLPNAGPDVTISTGQSAQLECTVTAGAAPFTYNWTPITGLNDPAIANPLASPAITTSYSVSVTDANSCSNSDTVMVTVNAGGFSINGNLVYEGPLASPLTNCQVELIRDGITEQTDTTDSGGNFAFHGVSPGEYSFHITISKNWGGGNAVDGLLITQHFVELIQLTGLKLQAADVFNLGSINSIDALTVLRRFVGLINSFEIADWIIENPTVIVSTSNVTVQIKTLCAGDVNTSYEPPQ